MKKPLLALFLSTALLAGSPFITPSWAKGKSLEQAVEQVRKQTGGRILDATTEEKNGKRVHRIKVLTPDGRVKVVSVPAE